MMRLLHLSDPHFGTERADVYPALMAAIAEARPDLVVISGDLTQRARRDQFRRTAQFIEALRPLPVLAVPGNHDIALYNIWSRLAHPYRGFRRTLRGRGEIELCNDQLEVFGFNSAKPWRHKRGELSASRLARRLAAPRLAPLRVGVFHHPLDVRREAEVSQLLQQSNRIAQTLAEHDVDLVLSGHVHDPLITTSQSRYPALDSAFVISVAGTCLSTRLRANVSNSFNLIVHDEGHLQIARYDFSSSESHFKRVQSEHFKRGPSGWVAHSPGL